MKCNAHQMENGACGLTGEKCIGRACMYHEPDQTNADRIRAMSDEELSAMLADDDNCCPPKHPNCSKHVSDCEGCWLEWLRQPAEEL